MTSHERKSTNGNQARQYSVKSQSTSLKNIIEYKVI